MKILVFEYITGGGFTTEPLPCELLREGEIMLGAKLRDLAGKSLMLLRDWRLPIPVEFEQSAQVLRVGEDRDFASAWQAALDWADTVWVTAPETGGVLAKLSLQVLQAGKDLLGSRPQAVALAGDKLATFRTLTQAGVACVPTWQLKDFSAQVPPPWIVKPGDGVGCQGMVLVEKPVELQSFPDDWLVQPFVAGEAMSLSMLCADGEAVPLSINRQLIQRQNGGFRLLGCEVNVLADLDGWQELAQKIASAIPGLWGYVGVDLIFTAQEALVLEVNPRLTLSYAGLSSALGESVGAWIVALATGKFSLQEIARRRRMQGGCSIWVEI